MKCVLIRHGKTAGNLAGRYIGCRTDEPLCPEGIAQLREGRYPAVERVFVSPLRRCRETARLLYPARELEIVEDFRECDFGAFEGLSYADLNGRADYQAWLDSGGEAPFPGGESKAEFSRRCVRAFAACVARAGVSSAAFVVHGGTIMAILEKYARPPGTYYDFQVGNGQGYALDLPEGRYRKLTGRCIKASKLRVRQQFGCLLSRGFLPVGLAILPSRLAPCHLPIPPSRLRRATSL